MWDVLSATLLTFPYILQTHKKSGIVLLAQHLKFLEMTNVSVGLVDDL